MYFHVQQCRSDDLLFDDKSPIVRQRTCQGALCAGLCMGTGLVWEGFLVRAIVQGPIGHGALITWAAVATTTQEPCLAVRLRGACNQIARPIVTHSAEEEA